MNVQSGTNSKRAAAFVALVAGVTLLARVVIRAQQTNGILDALAFQSQFITILTNTLVLVTMIAIAVGRNLPPAIVRAVIVAIACVGLLYHLLLAHLVSLSGLELLADHGTHTFVPILTVVWWLIWAERTKLSLVDPILWIAWPLTYTVYILARASISGFYPYPFLNLPEIGIPSLAINILTINAGFIVVGIALTGIAKLLPR